MPKPPAACLIGWPAAHSRSPLIHHYWLRTLGIEGGYDYSFVAGTGHLLQIEKPDECARLTLAFLGKHGLA